MLLTALLVSTNLAVLLDIPVFRPVLGFVFLTLIPGYLIICLLNLDKLGLTERFVLSVGFSIFFSMFFGLLINWLYFNYFGYVSPLSTRSVIISFSVILIIIYIISYKINGSIFSLHIADFSLSTKDKTFLLIPSICPFLSIYGTDFMNSTGNNIYLMILLFLIPSYVILITTIKSTIPEKIYPPMIYLMGVSILLMFPLRSDHILGLDAHAEYHLFQMTLNNQRWQVFETTSLASCLSISLLPAIYQSITNIDPERLFCLLYALTFSISALVVFIISNKYLSSFYAFLSAFFFISIPDFAITSILARSNMAILFFGLSIMVLFHENIGYSIKRLILIMFLSCVVVSHYSTTYILFFILLITFMLSQIIRTTIFSIQTRRLIRFKPNMISTAEDFVYTSGHIRISFIVLFFVLFFLWHSQITEFAFDRGIMFVKYSLTSLQKIFILESRSPDVLAAFGQRDDIKSQFVPKVIVLTYWMTIVLIVFGFFAAVLRFKNAVYGFPNHNTLEYILQKMDYEFFMIASALCLMMTISLVIPGISAGYGLNRQYIMSAMVLSTFLVLGAISIGRYIGVKPCWILATVLVTYFLCTSGALYQITGTPSALTLNSDGKLYDVYYISNEESHAAKWLGNHREKTKMIYGDRVIGRWLLSQASIPHSDVDGSLSSVTLLESDKNVEGYIYLRSHNLLDGKLMGIDFQDYDFTEYEYRFAEKAKCYSNNGAEVWL